MGIVAIILGTQAALYLSDNRPDGFRVVCGVAFLAGGAWTLLGLTWSLSLVCPLATGALNQGLCAPVDIYCERTSAALDAEPINALTNIAFLIAALAAWRLWRTHRNSPARQITGFLIGMIAVVGLGSFLFHTVATRWAEWGDVIPILVFVVAYLWLILRRAFEWSSWSTVVLLSLFLTVTISAEAWVPPKILWGGAMYVPTLLAIVALAASARHHTPAAGRGMLTATVLFIASFAARTLDMRVCSTIPMGTHFLWHFLNALLLYLLVRVAVLHLPTRSAHRIQTGKVG